MGLGQVLRDYATPNPASAALSIWSIMLTGKLRAAERRCVRLTTGLLFV